MLAINTAMFLIEMIPGLASPTSLQVNSLDFVADTDNYGINLILTGEGMTMALFEIWVLAALGVLGMLSGWPDVIVASIIGSLALQDACYVIRQASGELNEAQV